MRFWLLLSTLVVFSAGLAAGVFVARAWAPQPRSSDERRFPSWPDSPVPFLTCDEVEQQLELTDVQRQMVTHQLATHKKHVQGLFDSMAEVREDLLQGIYTALTPAQQEKLDDLQREKWLGEIRRRLDMELPELRQQLALTAEQEQRVKSVLEDYGVKTRQLSGSRLRVPAAERPAREDALRTWRSEQLGSILSAEQMGKYKDIKDRQRRGGPFRKRGEKRGGENGPPAAIPGAGATP